MRIVKKAAVFTAAAGLLSFGAVVGSGGSAFAGQSPDYVVTSCAAYVNTAATGFEPNCASLSGSIANPTAIEIAVDTDGLAALITAQAGQGLDASWTLSCMVDGAAVVVPGTYDVTSTAQDPYVVLDLQTMVGSPEPTQCTVENLTVDTALSISATVVRGRALTAHSLTSKPLNVSGFTVGAAALANVALPGAVYQNEGTTSAGAHAVLCADDTANGYAGSKVQGFQCLSDVAQSFVQTSSGELVHNGDCLNVTVGGWAYLAHCGAYITTEQWSQSTAGGTVMNMSTNTCLTAASAMSGMQLTVTPCGTGANQKWSIPAVSSAPVLPNVQGRSIWAAVRHLK